ncbi:hypothetical protein D3C81_1106290 [compost metagenome]
MLPRDHRDRDQEGDDHHDVLRHLRPRDRAHAAQERAHQDAGQPEEHPHGKLHADKARDDQPHALNLRHQIDERAQRGREHRNRPHRQVAAGLAVAVARREEVRDRVSAIFTQIRRQQERHQTIAAGPSHHIGQPLVAGGKQDARQADERRRAHPVRGDGHAIEQRRHPSPRHVILVEIRGPADQADAGIDRNGDEQEDIAEPQRVGVGMLEQPHHADEAEQPEREQAVIEQQPAPEARLGISHGRTQENAGTRPASDGRKPARAGALIALASADRGWPDSRAWTYPA